MSKIGNKMKYLLNTKNLIRNAISKKGIEISDKDSFRSYAEKINLLNESFGGRYNIIQKNFDDDTCDLIISDAVASDNGINKGKYVCKVIDYNGDILKEQHLNAGDIFILPDLPQHDGLIAQGYSSASEIFGNQIIVNNTDVIVGIIYTTESGLTEFDIELNKLTGLKVILNLSGTKDWGDGTSDNETSHTYTDYGKYTIKCDGKSYSARWGFFQQGSGSLSGTTTANYYCKNIRIGKNLEKIDISACESCHNLQTITIPNTITEISSLAFRGCSSLKSLIIPNNVIKIGDYVLQYCYSLQNIIIPNSVNSIGTYLCAECYSLTDVILSNNINSIGSLCFMECHSLKNIFIGNNINNIGGGALRDCFSLTNIIMPSSISIIEAGTFLNATSILVFDFSKSISIPTLNTVSAFTGINTLAKIIVPDNLYNEWLSAANWSTYADYIYKVSEAIK